MYRLTLCALLVLALLTRISSPARAQEAAEPGPSASWTDADTLRAVGLRDGRAAAGERGVGGRAALAFVGGLPVGFFGLVALSDRDAVQLGSTGAGLLMIGGAASSGDVAPPPALLESATTRGLAYEQGFRAGYAERLRSRRRSAAFWGGLTGTAVGFGTLIWLLSQLT